MIKIDNLYWISSSGGPLVLLQASILATWQGTSGEDYRIAGAVTGYAGVVKKEGCDVLVLWGEPMATAAVAHSDGYSLVRWMYAPDERHVLDAMSEPYLRLDDPIEKTQFLLLDPVQYLIDSAESGGSATERLELPIPVGSYTVATFDYRPSESIELIIHKFIRL